MNLYNTTYLDEFIAFGIFFFVPFAIVIINAVLVVFKNKKNRSQ